MLDGWMVMLVQSQMYTKVAIAHHGLRVSWYAAGDSEAGRNTLSAHSSL